MTTVKTTSKPTREPLHPVCKNNVEKPTLIRELRNGIEIWLQWFGYSNHFDLSGKQFLFPINTDPGNFFWQPENFRVIMIGPAKKWPSEDSEVVNHMIKQCGGENVIIIYYISSKFGVDDGNGGTVPAAGVLPLSIQLADDNCGLINPVDFFDDSVRTDAIRNFQS